MSKTRKRRDNGSFCNENNQTLGVSVTEMPQSKVKYSKVDESREEQVFNFKKSLLELFEEFPEHFITSSEKGIGKENILNFITETNKSFINPNIQATGF